MFLKDLTVITCDKVITRDNRATTCGRWELIAVVAHPTLPNQKKPLFFTANEEEPATLWHYSPSAKTWFCPRCGAERRLQEESALALQDAAHEEAKARLQGDGLRAPVPFPEGRQLAQRPSYSQPAPQTQATPPQAPQPPPQPLVYVPGPPHSIQAPTNQMQAPLVVPAVSGGGGQHRPPVMAAAPVMAPQYSQAPPQQYAPPAPAAYPPAPYDEDAEILPAEPLSIPAQAGPAQQRGVPGEAQRVPVDQMPVRFDVPPFPGQR